MPELIAMRVVQGLGAGAVGPIVLTMLGDLFTLEERARVQGLFSAVWGVSSVAGPWLGGYLTDNLSWRWVFYVTVPVRRRSRPGSWSATSRRTSDAAEVLPIDWPGAALLASGSTLLLLAILSGPTASIASVAGLLAGLVVLLGAVRRRRAAGGRPDPAARPVRPGADRVGDRRRAS